MSSSVTIQGTLTVPQGSLAIGPLTIAGDASDLLAVSEFLASATPTVVAVPTWAVGCLVNPGSSLDTHTLSFKMLVGDTGAKISPANPSVIALDNSNLPSNLYFTSSGTDTHYTTVTFF